MKNWQLKVGIASSLFLTASLSTSLYAQESAFLQLVALHLSSESVARTPARTNPKKVWTNDSISEVRTPADKYQDEKDAAAQASANSVPGNASKPAAPGSGALPLTLHIPETPEETQKAIDERLGLNDNFLNLLSNAQKRLQTENDPLVRATLIEKAKLLAMDIDTTNSEIKTLQEALVDYQHGKTPEQPKPETNKAPAGEQPKPAASIGF